MKTKQIILIFIPAISLAILVLFIRIIQYEPLMPKLDDQNKKMSNLVEIYPNDPILGYKKAGITIVAFQDFSCPACQSEIITFYKLIQKYPEKIKIIWKGLAITDFPFSTKLAHEYAYCMNEQDNFENFIQFAFANSDNLNELILSSIIKQDFVNEKKLSKCLKSGQAENYVNLIKNQALQLNIQSIPAVFINNAQIKPPSSLEGWEILLNL